MSGAQNCRLRFRPLIGGLAISSPDVGVFGTLGCFGRSIDGVIWGITARHVVSTQQAPARVSVFQSDFRRHLPAISTVQQPPSLAPGLDVLGFAIADGTEVLPEILELGAWKQVVPPLPGVAIWKMGSTTGLTRGTIGNVEVAHFEILPWPGMPAGYIAFDRGDSGAAWFTQEGMHPVGIHVSENPRTSVGTAARIDICMQRMGLSLVR